MEEKSKFIKFLESPIWMIGVLILVAVITFSLGRLSVLKESREPVKVISSELSTSDVDKIDGSQTASVINSDNGGSVVASKNGTKYHYPWCAGAKQISPKNLISFDSIESARASGYTPAGNCKGLK